MSVGTATSVKSWAVEKWKPALFRLTAVTLHSTQTQKARNSAKIENVMLRRATARPRCSQNASSSGSQCSIHGFVPIPMRGPRSSSDRPVHFGESGGRVGAGSQEKVARWFLHGYDSNSPRRCLVWVGVQQAP